MKRPKSATSMARYELIAEVRRLRRIERLARVVHDLDATPFASDKRALLVALWGAKAVDAP